MRMLRMESVQKDVLDGVEKTLRAEFMSNLARSTRRDAHEMMAEIFNNLDRASESRFVAALEQRNRESADKHQGADVHLRRPGPAIGRPRCRDCCVRSRRTSCRWRSKARPKSLRELFFKNLSERAGKMLRDDIDSSGAGQAARRRRCAGRGGGVGEGACGRRHDRDQRRQGRGAGLLACSHPTTGCTAPASWACSTPRISTTTTQDVPAAEPDTAAEPEIIEPVFTAAELDAARAEGRGRPAATEAEHGLAAGRAQPC